MLRRLERIYSPAIDREMEVLAYGHFGPPLIAFPSGGGRYYDFESNGMVDAIAPWIEAGKLKVYCPQGYDRESWLNKDLSPHRRAVSHKAYEDFIVNQLVPMIREDCRTPNIRIGMTGCSLGAYHAANFGLKFPHLFSWCLCMSGLYDLTAFIGESQSPEVYFNNVLAYTRNFHGAHLDWVRANAYLILVCGQGPYEDTNLVDTRALAGVLSSKQIRHECDIWGLDVRHDWEWWRRQIVYHMKKLHGEP